MTIVLWILFSLLAVSTAWYDLPHRAEEDGHKISRYGGFDFMHFHQGTLNFILLIRSLGDSGECIVVQSPRAWVDNFVMRMRQDVRIKTMVFIYKMIKKYPHQVRKVDSGFYNSKKAANVCQLFHSYQYDGTLDGQVIGKYRGYRLEDYTREEKNFVLFVGATQCYLIPNARTYVVDFFNRAKFHLSNIYKYVGNPSLKPIIPQLYMTAQAAQECRGKASYQIFYTGRNRLQAKSWMAKPNL